MLIAPAVEGARVIILEVNDCLAAAGLQHVASWCVVVKWAKLTYLYLWVLRSLHTAVISAQKQTAAADQHLQLPIQQACSTLCNNSMLLVTYAWL